MFKKMCIIGVGLIGGSIARATKKQGLAQKIVGVGRNEAHLQQAVSLGVIDEYDLELTEAVNGADVVVVCTPVGSMQAIFEKLKTVWCSTCLYTDAGSTKGSVQASLESVFGTVPSNVVLAHPIAGSEKNGVEASRDDLFLNKRSIITPLETTQESYLNACKKWWQGMGARVEIMSVEHHDEVLAATSHLPHVLAYSLVELLKNKQDEREIFQYAAGGFKDFTRIASSDPQMWADICLANKTNLLNLIGEMNELNETIRQLIEKEDQVALLQLFQSAQDARQHYLELQKNLQ